jgi:hypothetical protein
MKNYKVESKYKNPDKFIEKLKMDLNSMERFKKHWQKLFDDKQAELQKHPKVTVASDANALEQAVASPEFEFIYIPAMADITQAITRSILQRNPLNKRILWETQGQ